MFQNHVDTPLLFRLMGFRGARTPPLFKLLYLVDKAALRAQFLRWAATPGLCRIVPSHGPVIEEDPSGVLARAAASLAPP